MEQTQYTEINILELLSELLRRWWIILIVAVVSSSASLAWSLNTYSPVYTSTATIYIFRQNSSDSVVNYNASSDFSLALSLTADCTKLITSRLILNTVCDNLDLDISYETLAKNISVVNSDKTRILEVSVTNPDPAMAKAIVDDVCTESASQIVRIMGMDQVNIIDSGDLPDKPSNSRITTLTYIIPFMAVVLVCGIIILIYILDDKIKTPDDVTKYLGLSTLGLIPNSNTSSKSYGKGKDGYYQYYYYKPYGQASKTSHKSKKD